MRECETEAKVSLPRYMYSFKGTWETRVLRGYKPLLWPPRMTYLDFPGAMTWIHLPAPVHIDMFASLFNYLGTS